MIHIYTVAAFLLTVAILALYGWFWYITLRAYRYMRDVVEPHKGMHLSGVATTATDKEKERQAFNA